MRDEFLRREVRAALERESVPSIDVHAILSRPLRHKYSPPVYVRIVLAAAAGLVLAVLFTPQTFADAVKAMRLPFFFPPKAIVRTLRVDVKKVRSPQEAQALVRFQLTSPSGLPQDARIAAITAGPSGAWRAQTKRWVIGPTYVMFTYRRNDGHVFRLQAERYDPAERQNAYVWDADTGQRFDRLAWRNGDQQMSAVADGISDMEILRIERAMNGTPIDEVKTRGPHGGPKFFVIPRNTQQ